MIEWKAILSSTGMHLNMLEYMNSLAIPFKVSSCAVSSCVIYYITYLYCLSIADNSKYS